MCSNTHRIRDKTYKWDCTDKNFRFSIPSKIFYGFKDINEIEKLYVTTEIIEHVIVKECNHLVILISDISLFSLLDDVISVEINIIYFIVSIV